MFKERDIQVNYFHIKPERFILSGTPAAMSRLRAAILLLLFYIDKIATVRQDIYLAQPQTFTIEDNVFIDVYVILRTERENSQLNIGSLNQIKRNVVMDFAGDLYIRISVLISECAVLYECDNGLDSRYPQKCYEKSIERGALNGAKAIELEDCCVIGEEAIIGAGSVIMRDIPPCRILAEETARPIGQRPQEK